MFPKTKKVWGRKVAGELDGWGHNCEGGTEGVGGEEERPHPCGEATRLVFVCFVFWSARESERDLCAAGYKEKVKRKGKRGKRGLTRQVP